PPPPPPPPPAYPRRESPILKYLLTIIVLGAIGFGLYKYGPDIWGNVQAILPQDFMVFLSCLGKVLTSGDMKSIENCFQGGGQLELPQRPEPTYVNPNIIGLSVGYGDTKRPETPIGGKKYTTYVKIENYNPDEPVEVKKVWGNLEYEATENDITLPGRKELTPEDNECTEDNPCEIRKSKKLVTLVSGEELDCTTKNYDRLIVYAEFDYDTNESIDYVVGRTEEAVEAAKTHELVFKPSPVDIQFEFSPEYWVTLDTYLPIIVRGLDAYSPTKKVRIIFENKGSGKAIINGIKIERTGTNSESDPNTFAKLKGCNNCFGKVDIIEEGKIIPVEKVELYQDPLQCVCEYSIHNPNDFLGEEDPYKTFSFDVSLFYTYRKTLTKTNIPEADLDSYCKETTTTAITRTTTTTTTIGSGRGHIP
ncbi:MAG: hypothetical protein ISS48_00005, partial [Candidatus Aenigmarchaeota archaeon]|nr:hypothetical protein [Candidatus Aenigmarchaeota archaeon]